MNYVETGEAVKDKKLMSRQGIQIKQPDCFV